HDGRGNRGSFAPGTGAGLWRGRSLRVVARSGVSSPVFHELEPDHAPASSVLEETSIEAEGLDPCSLDFVRAWLDGPAARDGRFSRPGPIAPSGYGNHKYGNHCPHGGSRLGSADRAAAAKRPGNSWAP